MCWGRCQADLGHCSPGKGIGHTLVTRPDPPSRDTGTGGWPQGSGFPQQLWSGEFHISPPLRENKCLRGLVGNAWCPQDCLVSLRTPRRELCCTALPVF